MTTSKRVMSTVLIGLLANGAALADSNLDPTWNSPGGYTVTTPGIGNASPNAMALDSIGRVLVAGDAQISSGGFSQFTVVRYTGDNDPALTGFEDNTFGNGGIATVNIGANNAIAHAVVAGPNQSAVVAGECSDISGSQYRAFCLVRFTNNGALDLSFGETGRTVSQLGPDHAYARAMALDSTGRLLVAGSTSSPVSGNPVFTVARYTANGQLDGSFGPGGFRIVADPAGGSASAFAIAVDSDDKIVLAGSVANFANPNGAVAVVRLNANGTTDTSFNGGVIASVGFTNGGGANALTIDAQHRPVLAGVAIPGGALTTSAMALVRYTSAGVLDATFGTNGVAIRPLAGCTEANATAIRIDVTGRYFVGGNCRTTQSVLALVHVNSNGSLDSAYGGKGYSTEQFGSQAGINALLIDAKGRPLVAGFDLRGNGFYAYVINRHDVLFSHGME